MKMSKIVIVYRINQLYIVFTLNIIYEYNSFFAHHKDDFLFIKKLLYIANSFYWNASMYMDNNVLILV